MKLLLPLLVGFVYHAVIYADEFRFKSPTTVTAASKNVFLHLDSSGRRNIAVSDKIVAVVWEDNRSGQPAIYISFLAMGQSNFSKPRKISGQLPAYEPAISALSSERFLLGWEEGDAVWLSVVDQSTQGKSIKVGKVNSRQVSVATNSTNNQKGQNEPGAVVWSQGEKQKSYVYYSVILVDGFNVKLSSKTRVDKSKDVDVQLYPAVELTHSGSVVAWEDRRQGATRIFVSYAPGKGHFQPYRLLNEFSPSPNPEFGKGSGAMRPVLAGSGNRKIVAAWMDKRNWRSGYDVFSAVSLDSGETFGKNEQAQDMFGDNVPQWHATAALRANDGAAVVAWDDTRNETPDVFYSLRLDNAWSEDYEMPGATGEGRQTHPSIVFDQNGVLHVVWLDNSKDRSRLLYTHTSNTSSEGAH